MKEIIDAYIENHFESVFIRQLNNYGCAFNNRNIFYDLDDFVSCYKNAVEYIIRKNLDEKIKIREDLFSIILRKILSPFNDGFVDMQNPCALGQMCMIVKQNGDIFPSDESRMISEMGNSFWKMGNVNDKSSLSSILKKRAEILENGHLENYEECKNCVYSPFCYADPIKRWYIKNIAGENFKNEEEKIKDVMICENGKNHLLFRCEKNEITLLVTTKCNQRCVMCPQKLNVDSSENDLIIRRVLENLDYKFFTGITFTGGEPLLKTDLIELALEKSPKNVFITILSNGSVLPSQKILSSGRVKMCVPLYSSFDGVHNLMTSSSSFYKVVKNLMRISSFDVPLELRFVMTRLNSKNLLEFFRFAARNLPFVQDIAFMGMELTESALKNRETS